MLFIKIFHKENLNNIIKKNMACVKYVPDLKPCLLKTMEDTFIFLILTPLSQCQIMGSLSIPDAEIITVYDMCIGS